MMNPIPLTKSPPKAKIPLHGDNTGLHSPRKVKQQRKMDEQRSMEFTSKDHINILPGNFDESHMNGTGTMQDILQFGQRLRDAIPSSHILHSKLDVKSWSIPQVEKPEKSNSYGSNPLSLLASNKITFEILTSDRGQRVISSLVNQWEVDKFSDNGRTLWTIVDTFFTSLPYVFVREQEIHSKVLIRYIAALSTLKDIIVQALFCTNPSAAMAITASLTPTHHEKIPLYWYCHQMEREIQSLKNSSSDQSWEMVHSSDIGLLQEATANVLLNFWKLPRRERIAFLTQVFSNVSEIEGDLVRILLENSTFLLQRVLEELGFEEKSNKQQPRMSTIGAVVSMSVQASHQARQLHKWRSNMRQRNDNLEPIQVRHKGIQVNGGDAEADDHLGSLVLSPPKTPIRLRRSLITNDKSLKMVLMQDYQPFGRKEHQHLLVHDMWTVASFTENLIHHLSAFLDNAHEARNVPTEVVLLATLLLEWLLFEKSKAISNGKDQSMEVLDNPHFQQSVVSLMEVLKSQSETQVPDSIRTLATTLQDFMLQKKIPPASEFHSGARPEINTTKTPETTPADLRNLLRHGFPADVVNIIMSISTDGVEKERESKTLLLIEQLEHHMMGKIRRQPSEVGFGQAQANCGSGSSAILKTLMDQMKALLIDNSDGKVNEQKASSLLLDFMSTFKHDDESNGLHDRAKMLNIETLCNVLEKKFELQVHNGPLDKATRIQMGQLQKFINKLLPQEAPMQAPPLSVTTRQNNIIELVQLLEQALAKKDTFDAVTASTLEALHIVLLKTQSKMHGQPVDICVSTLIQSLQATGDENLQGFCSGIDEMAMSLRAILASCVEANGILDSNSTFVDESSVTPHGNIDDIINDPRIDTIPVFIINLSKKLKTLSETAQLRKATHHQSLKSETLSQSSTTKTDTLAHHHASIREESQPRAGRKGGAAASNPVGLFASLWETTKTKKPNVLGMSANELSDMFGDNKTVLNLGTVQKLIYQIYRERYECNLTEQDNPNTTAFIDFVYDWYLRKYGLRKLAMQHLSKLLLSLKKQKKKSKKAVLFCRFLGLFPPQFDYSALNFALGLLNVWTNGTFTTNASTNRVSLTSLQQTLDDGYDRRFGPFCSTTFAKERLMRNASSDDPTSIDQDVALEISLEEFVKMKNSVELMLEDIYRAGDMNSDNKMGFDEFATVVRNLAPCVSDREIVKMFKEALLDSSFDSITRQRFVNVIIDQGILSSRVNKFKAPTGTSNTSAFPEYEQEQFELLEETWRAHEAETIKAIEKIPHKETSTSLLLRVRILNMIISKRIDSETAWLSHRMILRDVGRFKDLNEVAISEIKKKEAFFKDAVTRITTARFGLFREPPKQPDKTIKNEAPAPTIGVVEFVERMEEYDEKSGENKDDDGLDIGRIEDSLRTEILNLAENGNESTQSIETQLEIYDDAVKKVRRVSTIKANKAIRKLTAVIKMSKFTGVAASAFLSGPLPSDESFSFNEEDQVDDNES